MSRVPPVSPLNPGGDRQFQAAWEDLLRIVNRPHRNRFTVAVTLDDATPQGYGAVGMRAVDTIGGNAPDYVVGMSNCTALSTSALSVGTLRAVSFRVDEPRRITTVAFRVTGAGGAGSKGRLAIYSSKNDIDGDWYPDRLLWQGTEHDTNASTGTLSTSTALDLLPGRRYWAVYWCGTSAPTVNTVPVAAQGTDLASAAGTPTTYVSATLTYSSSGFPTFFPSGGIGVATVSPAIMLTMTRPTTYAATTNRVAMTVPESGVYVLNAVRIVKASALPRTANARPYVLVEAGVLSGATFNAVGQYDSRTDTLGVGLYRSLAKNIEVALREGESLAARVTQGGWPPVMVRDATVSFDIGVL